MARFKELRIKKGLTQEELITQFNDRYGKRYGASSISMFENNKRIPETQALMDFADFFNVSVDYLLGRTDQPQGTGFQKGLLGDADSLAQKAREANENASFGLSIQGDLVKIDDVEISLQPKSADRVKKAIEIALHEELEAAKKKSQLKPSEQFPIKKSKEIYSLISSIMLIDDLYCDGIETIDVMSIDLNSLVATPLISDILDEQKRESITYLVPEMFHMKEFIDSLRNHILHYKSEPQVTVGAFKETCARCLKELRMLMYETMEATDEQLERYPRNYMYGMEYCVINNDLYRMEKNGPGRYILTKQLRPHYDPTPREKRIAA